MCENSCYNFAKYDSSLQIKVAAIKENKLLQNNSHGGIHEVGRKCIKSELIWVLKKLIRYSSHHL